MSGYYEDKERYAVPRLRSFVAAVRFGEVEPLDTRPTQSAPVHFLRYVLEDWKHEPNVVVASDVVAAAFAMGCSDEVRDIASFVVENEDSTEAARHIAKRCLSDTIRKPSNKFQRDYEHPSHDDIGVAIRRTRKRLNTYIDNPIMWANLAMLYTTVGERKKAERAMEVAIGCAPNNRFVVRSGSRLFLHHGDAERAHDLLLRTDMVKFDPWVLASEVSLAGVRKMGSKLMKRAFKMAEAQAHSPFNLSELLSALATAEGTHSNFKKMKKLGRRCLAEPSENAIAQCAWLSRRFEIDALAPTHPTETKSSEANAWSARTQGNWQDAFDHAEQWHTEQPFSSRPAILAGYIAATALEDFERAEKILRRGQQANDNDAMLCNNLAFTLANTGQLEAATRQIEKARSLSLGLLEKTCVTATAGLVAFRAGNFMVGRDLYNRAILLSAGKQHERQRTIAQIYLALEEQRAGTSEAITATTKAIAMTDGLPPDLKKLFRKKLETHSDKGTYCNV